MLFANIGIDSSNVPIKQIVKKLCLFKRWQSSSSSYEKRCLGAKMLYLDGENEVLMGIHSWRR